MIPPLKKSRKMKMIEFTDTIEKYNAIIKESLSFNYLLRDSDLQKEQIEVLENFRKEIKSYKYQFIEQKNETLANVFFHFQCVLNAIKSNLELWILIKERNYEVAWKKLVDAQEYLEVALRIDGDHYGIDDLLNTLLQIEKLIFPGWPLFNSCGFIEKRAKCSICKQKYGDCEHLEGLVYMGRLCQRIEREFVRFDHSALVKNPYDKRCIIRWVSTEDGKKRDYITWKVTDEDVRGENGQMTMGSILFNMDVLDFS